ncbi:MAG: hypothetical protein QWI36_01000 [Wolbachia endosymbiont of Tyrophagus putrescentiae]|nr:hypothetical protein [Wolbachia endosymbiont of Tyrophagus putrescentiae]
MYYSAKNNIKQLRLQTKKVLEIQGFFGCIKQEINAEKYVPENLLGQSVSTIRMLLLFVVYQNILIINFYLT